jgi:hypothetical protein
MRMACLHVSWWERIAVMVRLGEAPASLQRLQELASALLSLHRLRCEDTHAGPGWRGMWDAWRFCGWEFAPIRPEPEPAPRAWRPCPACGGSGAASCEICLGEPWREKWEEWEILRQVTPVPVFLEWVQTDVIDRPHMSLTPDGRLQDRGGIGMDTLQQAFGDCWVVSAAVWAYRSEGVTA